MGKDDGLKDDCLFCKIGNGKIPSAKVFENEHVFAFLDIAPVHKGHALVIPKKHFETITDMPDETLAQVALAVKKVTKAVKDGMKCDGVNVTMNNGKASGQLVFHAHFHIIPRYDSDGLKHWPHGSYKDGEMIDACEKITKAMK